MILWFSIDHSGMPIRHVVTRGGDLVSATDVKKVSG